MRHWLKGINNGKTDIFIENLPGGPDNINLAPDGSFWIALVQVTIFLFNFYFYLIFRFWLVILPIVSPMNDVDLFS